MIAGARHNEEICFEILVKDKFAELRAFDPKVFGVSRRSRDLTFGGTTLAIQFIFYPVLGYPVLPLRLFRGLSARAGRRPHALGDIGDETSHRFYAFLCRLAMPIERGAQGFDDRRADHHPIGVSGDCGSASGVFHAKADRDRQARMRLDAAHRRSNLGRFRGGGSGNARDRDVIDKARSMGENGWQPCVVVRRRRREADEIEPRRKSGQAELRISSSGGRSTMIKPSTPAAFASRRKTSTPYT